MIDISGIEWNWWGSVGWWLIPVVALILLGTVCISLWEYAEGFQIACFGVAAVWFAFSGPVIMGVVPNFFVGSAEKAITTEQLEAQGYENIDLNWRSGFTASKAGQYFIGSFYPLGDYKYKVVEVPLD